MIGELRPLVGNERIVVGRYSEWRSILQSFKAIQIPRGDHLPNAMAYAYAEAATASGHQVRRIDVAKLDFALLRTQPKPRRPAWSKHANRVVRSLIMTASAEDWPNWVLHVTDNDGDVVFEVLFATVLGKSH